ncbi:hypothetical protein [Pseudoalteromonas piratica]|uniref:hypothetical protein n=1 Tax=Pseudoalteromonas piratica TaxID=1348114 RepID=UPI000A57379E|nr:hypothetical protein [Pseudoalteromonas piratica]
MTTQYTRCNNVVHVTFASKQVQTTPEAKNNETLAEMFKRHKVVVPSELIFKYK